MSRNQLCNQFPCALTVLSRPGHSARAQGSFYRDTREAGRSSTLTLMRSGLLTRKDMDPPPWDTRSRKGGTPAGRGASHPLSERRPPPSPPRVSPTPGSPREGRRGAVTPVNTTRYPQRAPTPVPGSPRTAPRGAVTPVRAPPKHRHPRTPSGPPPGPSRTPQAAAAAHRRETLRVTSARRDVMRGRARVTSQPALPRAAGKEAPPCWAPQRG